MDKREILKEVFADTQKYYQEDPVLDASVQKMKAATRLYEAEEYPPLAAGAARAGEIRVTTHKTFEAAAALAKEFPGRKIAVLNFASAVRPGGGVKHGSRAQEESLCRCSTLFASLDRRWLWNMYYDVNRAAKNVLHSDACIYSPGVVICKTDESVPKRLAPEEFVTVDVISCAAPNLSPRSRIPYNPETGDSMRLPDQALYEIQLHRARHIIHIAAAKGVDLLVLGAFGCGAFANDPKIVAKAMRGAIRSYVNQFDVVEFAIPRDPVAPANHDAFRAEFKGLAEA